MAVSFTQKPTFEGFKQFYSAQYDRAYDEIESSSVFLEELVQRVSTLRKQTLLMNPYAEKVQTHVSKLTQIQQEMRTLGVQLQDVYPEEDTDQLAVWYQWQDNVKKLGEQSIMVREKIEELGFAISTRLTRIQPQRISTWEFTPSTSPAASSFTLKDLMALDREASSSTTSPLIESRSNPMLSFQEESPECEFTFNKEDSDDDGYAAEVPTRAENVHLSSLSKKSRSIESGLNALQAEEDPQTLDEEEEFDDDDVDAGQSIEIHIAYIHTRAKDFSLEDDVEPPKDWDYAVLDRNLSNTYRHAGKFLRTMTKMTLIELRIHDLDRISLSEVLKTLVRELRTMKDGAKCAVDRPKEDSLIQAKTYKSFITRNCLRIERVAMRMLEKIAEIEFSLAPLVAMIQNGTNWSLPTDVARLVVGYLIEQE